ncbi:MAG TPA: 4Fe-4S dicluster domain-containing protein [Methanothermococcus okinawensis]|uniref:Energy-converting hydrogenase B subunit L n=1 Tax=Methanofervidicoccus abyssi TaxID=2082189 RepID=A0A401HQ20_9EURY|nr:4Fe-4S binding protein [Methanofervidicoccus abyssi]GBF36377.1 energy-converting hydrogenase B subunit L [Methanofervidicoccus abyssi]HIP16127.1 4Fe-4S dicluster domain-containing protein [Methanothermococcus okinawensis]
MDQSLKNLAKLVILGAYKNIERILLGTDTYTSEEMRKEILSGVKLPRTVLENLCIGCEGCANACPTGCIQMKKIEPVKLAENYIKKSIPVIDPTKCIYCLYCHDFCPVFSIFNEISPIHPRDVGEEYVEVDLSKIFEKPVDIPESQLKKIASILSINLRKLMKDRGK